MEQLKESIQKTKKFFHRTVQNIKSLLFGGYEKIPKPISFNPFSCGSNIRKHHQTDRFYTDLCNDWECDLEKAIKRKNSTIMVSEEAVKEKDTGNGGSMKLRIGNSPVKKKEDEQKNMCNGSSFMKLENTPLKKTEEEAKQEKSMKRSHSREAEQECPMNMNAEASALAQKMKELEKMEVTDVENILDVEEAIHYYSRLKSPVYLGIVDKFFTDMYSEFSVPPASASINKSKHRQT